MATESGGSDPLDTALGSGTVPESFEGLVRDALQNLYDVAYLQTHPLASALGSQPRPTSRGTALRQSLVGSIESLRPGDGVDPTSRAWRSYRILELRYIDERDVTETLDLIGLSKNQFHRDHNRALQAVASILWDQWRLADRWPLDQAATKATSSPHLPSEGAPAAGLPSESPSTVSASIDPEEVFEGVLRTLQPLAEAHRVTLETTSSPAMPRLRGDRVALRQALLAVLSHAIPASHGDRIEVSLRSGGKALHADIAGRLAGLAVTIGAREAGQFVSALGGEITAETERDGKWRIQMSFPTPDQHLVLVVDNNADFVRLVERYLTGTGWSAVGAPDVDSAYELARHGLYSAVLLDVVLPGRDGWELLQALKGNPETRQMPVIVCSVLREPEMALSLGAAAYLQKPVDRARMLEVLAKIGTTLNEPANNGDMWD